jgi:galactose-1-phosphate uridylyltransferase
MEMIQQLESLHSRPDISKHNFKSLLDFLVADKHVKGHTAEDLCQLDPRDGSMIVYAEHRSLRRDEHQPVPIKPQKKECPICTGNLTNVVDYASLSEGFTFISQNMFPVLYPKNLNPEETANKSLYPDPGHLGRIAFGFHLLQWTSSQHLKDWHNMPFDDVLICMKRLSILEEKVLLHSAGYMPISCEKNGIHGYVSIIKNYGAAAGASLTHGHQQIAFSNIMPQRTFNNCRFYERHGVTFNEYLFKENPTNLTIAQEGNARVIVPYFMRRPFNIIVLPETNAQHIHQLTENELHDVTLAMQKVIKTLHLLMPELGKDVSFNMAIHTGPDSKLYVEFFPVIQLMGGFERIGLWICQLSAEHAAAQFRELYQAVE